jgi:DNA-directed RNA polymerase subunit K/omega
MLPVYQIIDYTGNRYLLAKSVMKRARQINFIGDDELEGYNGKIVSLSMKQIFNSSVNYYIPGVEVTTDLSHT